MVDAGNWSQSFKGSSWKGRALTVVALLALLGGAGAMVASLISGPKPVKTNVQRIALIKQPPPPPPPKPPEKQPEPPKVKEEVKLDEAKPEPRPDPAKPADDKPVADKPLGVDADGASGSDGFGLAANRGGRDLLTTGGGSARYFTGLLQRNFFEALSRNRKVPLAEFSVVVSIWLGDDGRVLRTQILNSSGDVQLDGLIQSTLAEMAPLREVPPAGLRQVQLRLNRRA